MSTALTIVPAPDLLPAPLFAPTPKAAQRVVEFFTAQINNDHTRRAYLNGTRRFAGWCDAHGLAQLRKVLAALDEGDVLMVTRLDRLPRSTRDLLNTLATVTGKGAGFRSLGDAWADTTTPHGRLMVTMLAGLAEFERELIHARTSEGRKRAQAAGVKMGRPPKLTPFQQREARKRLAAGDSPRTIARSYGVHRSTIERLATVTPPPNQHLTHETARNAAGAR